MQEPNMNEHAYARAVLAEQLSTFATEAGMQVPAKFIENKLANWTNARAHPVDPEAILFATLSKCPHKSLILK